MPHVLAVDPPRVSEDRDTVLLTVRYDVPVTHRDLMGHAEPLEEAVAPTRADGLQVALGGELPATAEGQVRGTGELIGIVAALTILLLMFRSVVAAGLPVLVAVAGLAVGGAGHHRPLRRDGREPLAPRWWRRWSASGSASTTRCCC